MLTDDENIVDLQFAVQYVVTDATKYIFNVRRPDESAMQIAETAMREVIGKNRMDAILYETQVDIANKTRDLMQLIHDRYGTGIQISAVTVQNAQPPEQVQAAFDDAVKAGQDRERQKNEGQAYANDVIPRARRRLASAAGIRGLQAARDRQRRGRLLSLPRGADRVREGAPGDARAHLHRHDARDPVGEQQDHDGLPRQRQPADAAAREADAAGGRGRAAGRSTRAGDGR